MSDTPIPKADPAMFAPCPRPVAGEPANTQGLADGVHARDNPAEWTFVRLSRLIREFEAGLNPDEEVGARLTGLPGDQVMQFEDLGFWGPDLLLFFGRTPDGRPVRLVQHYSQVNVLLNALPKPQEREARRIGFRLDELVEQTEPV
ncbi:DUF6173 family protein [Brevundimonas balnearis]|uniref:DUF6173 family protein n=1 Tax=Brevundimonas balnearis TaxID=1572858 RepID=A0ABV6R0V3_9CAUL